MAHDIKILFMLSALPLITAAAVRRDPSSLVTWPFSLIDYALMLCSEPLLKILIALVSCGR
jgi:hypothetical protein